MVLIMFVNNRRYQKLGFSTPDLWEHEDLCMLPDAFLAWMTSPTTLFLLAAFGYRCLNIQSLAVSIGDLANILLPCIVNSVSVSEEDAGPPSGRMEDEV